MYVLFGFFIYLEPNLIDLAHCFRKKKSTLNSLLYVFCFYLSPKGGKTMIFF